VLKSVLRGSHIISPLAYLVILCGSIAPEACAADVGLTHGPLVGAVRPTAATIWVRANGPATLQVEYSTAPDFVDSILSEGVETDESRDLTRKIRLNGLHVETLYFYRVWANGIALPGTYEFKTNPSDSAMQIFSFTVLSDFRATSAPVYAQIARENPPFVIFLGDFNHDNPATLSKMRAMHRQMRGSESQAGLDFMKYIRQFPFYHVWDDHDFGKDNADKSFPGKKNALNAFREYFPTPSLPSHDGIWHRFRYAQVEFFMLDLRSQRDPNNTPDGPNKSILGADEKAWLKDSLLNSTARWKFLMSTVPFNPGTKPSDSWAAFQTERTEMVNFIQQNKIGGLIVVSGDLHSGGALDDGTNSGFPEISVPHANMPPPQCWTTQKPGLWSEGIICGIDNPGYGSITVTPDSVTLQVKGIDGDVRQSLEIS
jgi:alkaline phosphatase D